MKKRSLGVTLLGWFEILLGIWGGGRVFLFLFLVIAYNGSFDGMNNFFRMIYFSMPLVAFTFILINGIGILSLKKRAWKINIFFSPMMTIAIYIYIYTYKFFEYLEKTSFLNYILHDKFILLWIAIPVLIIFYLTRPKVRAQFFTNKPDINVNHSKEENAL